MHCRIWNIYFPFLFIVFKDYLFGKFSLYILNFQNFVFFLGENTVIIKIPYNLSKSLPILGVGQHGGPDHGQWTCDDDFFQKYPK
jgi:hypothetical protein